MPIIRDPNRDHDRPIMIDRELLDLLPTIGVEGFAIMALLTDRPCTQDELIKLSGLQDYHIEAFVHSLRRRGLIAPDDDDNAKRESVSSSSFPDPISRQQPGYVYLIKSSTGHWKIGRSKNPKDRLKTFGVILPFEVQYEHLIPADDMCKAESALHEKYAEKRVNGEWFLLTEDDIADIKAIERM